MESDFVFARRVDTGERVYIPLAHLRVFEGAFVLDQDAPASEKKPATPAKGA